MEEVKLTQYSHGAGCGCKISPTVLNDILHGNVGSLSDSRLLVGNSSRDDAAVYDIGNGMAIMSTTDFFMPIVDDPFTFGRIAAVNAISDIYAMGGTPLMAIAVLGWPVDKLDTDIARQVLDGGRFACKEAGIVLAGGHSIDNPEPVFGLAVTGQVEIAKVKRNDRATSGCKLYLTKPLGVGILTTAQKQGKLKSKHADIATESMLKLNTLGQRFADIEGITAMTDVTGFGLLGHLSEICEGSGLSARLEYKKIPIFLEVEEYISQKCIPGGTHRNWQSYGKNIRLKDENWKSILCDPQTSGGLLIAVEETAVSSVEVLLKAEGLIPQSIGYMAEREEAFIFVI
jgi:selenide,water dikinase